MHDTCPITCRQSHLLPVTRVLPGTDSSRPYMRRVEIRRKAQSNCSQALVPVSTLEQPVNAQPLTKPGRSQMTQCPENAQPRSICEISNIARRRSSTRLCTSSRNSYSDFPIRSPISNAAVCLSVHGPPQNSPTDQRQSVAHECRSLRDISIWLLKPLSSSCSRNDRRFGMC